MGRRSSIRFTDASYSNRPAPETTNKESEREGRKKMNLNLIEIWHGMNNLVRGVVLVLTLQALGCIAVTVDRLLMLVISYRRGRKFAKKAGPLLARGDYEGALAIAREHRGSDLAGFIRV